MDDTPSISTSGMFVMDRKKVINGFCSWEYMVPGFYLHPRGIQQLAHRRKGLGDCLAGNDRMSVKYHLFGANKTSLKILSDC